MNIFICKYSPLTPIFKNYNIADDVKPIPPDSLA